MVQSDQVPVLSHKDVVASEASNSRLVYIIYLYQVYTYAIHVCAVHNITLFQSFNLMSFDHEESQLIHFDWK